MKMLIAYDILVPLLAGLAVSLYLRRALCKLLALAFGHSGRPDATPESVLRNALIMATAGIVAGVAIVGRSIAKSIPKEKK